MMLPLASMIPPAAGGSRRCQPAAMKSKDSDIRRRAWEMVIPGVTNANGPGFTRRALAAQAKVAPHVDNHIGESAQGAFQRHVCRPAFGDAAQVQARPFRQPDAPSPGVHLDAAPASSRDWNSAACLRSGVCVSGKLRKISIIAQRLQLRQQRWVEQASARRCRSYRFLYRAKE